VQQRDLVAALLVHTAGLEPTDSSTQAELADLRRALIASFQTGQAISDVGTPLDPVADDPDLVKELTYLIANPEPAASPPVSGATMRVARRSTPVSRLALGAESSWAAGLKPSRTFGPFVDKAGLPSWFDVFTFAVPLEVRRAGAAADFLILPKGVTAPPFLLHRYRIPPGTVWIASSQFSKSAPSDTFVGIRVKSGELTVPGVAAPAEPLVVPSGSTVTLTIVPDPPSQAGPAASPGLDAANAQATFPASATFVFGPSGIESIAAEAASVNVYGATIQLSRIALAAIYDGAVNQILIPFTPEPVTLNIASVASPAFQPAGSGSIVLAAWGLTIAQSSTVTAGPAAGAGALVLIIQAGLTATWPGLIQGPMALNKAYISFDGETLLIFAPVASNTRAHQSFELWNDSALPGRCVLNARYNKPLAFTLLSDRQGVDGISASGDLEALIDQPVTAGSARLQPEFPANVAIIQNSAAMRFLAGSAAPPDASGKRLALALSNALITTAPADGFYVTGVLNTPTTADQGVFNLIFRPFQILPSLADPYAANFENLIRDAPVAGVQLRVTVTWPDPASPMLAFSLVPVPNSLQLGELMPSPRAIRQGDGLLEMFNRWASGSALQQLALLDVSSNADQFGVAFGVGGPNAAGPAFTFDNLALTTTGANAKSFLLPQFQWEPVYNKFNPLVGDPEGFLFSQNDGGPTLAGANSVTLVPVAPVSVAAEVVNAFAEEQKTAAVLFTLPFGIKAVAGLDPSNIDYIARPSLQLTAPDFGTLRAGRQLSLRAGTRFAPANKVFLEVIQSYLEGSAQQTPNFAGQAPDNALGPLGPNAFNPAFSEWVPISRVDFSGYGATTFSRWFDARNPVVGITQVCFDGFNGRTSYERVEMTSLLWPCLATVVRTITIERYGNGSPIRWDTGWIATSDGLFQHDNVNTFHKGVVEGCYEISEISDTDVFIDLKTAPGARLQSVYYDCNIGIKGVTRGAGANHRVPARRHLGFIQYIPSDQQSANVLNPLQVKELFDTQGPLGGPIDCTITIGASQQEMRVTGVYASNAGTNPANGKLEYAVAAYGSPVLPAAGHWSVVKVVNTTATVTALDPGLGIPLIQQAAQALRWADPSQMFAANPDFDYGFLFSNETQRILFPRLKVEPLDTRITSAVLPLLADPYSQLNSTGLFPLLNQALPFPAAPAFGLASVGGSLRLSPDPFTIPVSAPALSLIDVSSWSDVLNYADANNAATKFVINSASNWTIDSTPLLQKLNFPLVGDIVSLVHQIHSPVDDVASFPNPQFVFSGILKPVTDVFKMLESWMPDLPGPLKVSASFSGSTFQLSALADFQIADEDGNAIDVGIGKLKGDISAGANLSAELLKQTITGSVFLSITGSYQQEVFPLIYGGGQLAFRVSADQDGKTTLDFNAGTVGSVGGDLIPGVVSLEATVQYGYWMQVAGGQVAPGIDVGMSGRAKLLDGLLGFELGVEGRALISRFSADPNNLCHLLGSILISGSVQVAWVIDERKSWQADFDVKVGWTALLGLAKAGLLPVP
jgi:hypothetical protein